MLEDAGYIYNSLKNTRLVSTSSYKCTYYIIIAETRSGKLGWYVSYYMHMHVPQVREEHRLIVIRI